MNTLILWLWAFWYAIWNHLWNNNKNKKFFAYEKNIGIVNSIRETNEHPYFFKWYKKPSNIIIIDNYDEYINDIDLLIIAIPAQYINSTIVEIKNKLKNWVTILNLAKGIDIKNNNSISNMISSNLKWLNYNYWVLSWWMIASELIEWKILWADLWIINRKIWLELKLLLENDNLKINLTENLLNIELYWSLKNIAAILTWYYEWKWENFSTIWFYLTNFLNEFREIVVLYWWSPELNLWNYSFTWDLVATCFWNSRNRYFWQLLWKWNNINEVLNIMKSENKHAEWYETLKAVYLKIEDKNWFKIIKQLYNLVK